MSIKFRQVHLDFHTSESIEGIGARFSPDNFKQALIEGKVNSITLFSKCHHGWSYHPTTVNQIHPHLDFDLLGEQLKVCKELGVRTQIYLSGGFDEKYARAHKEHLHLWKGGIHAPFDEAGYHHICFNSPYLDLLCAEIEEVMQRYAGMFDGIFIDIVMGVPCYCPKCMADMKERDLDPEKDSDVMIFVKELYQRYCDAVGNAVHKYVPDMPIIHNDGGAIFQGRKVAMRNNRHFELESLPTGGWGYDHFPRAAAYARSLDKEFIGMTGKFHKGWGEFGGFKHPNALRYETALSNACGAGCSVGDQLHPDGEFDLATYRLIGKAYEEVEAREPYLENAKYVADIGLVSAEACLNSSYAGDFNFNEMAFGDLNRNVEKPAAYRQDFGANRMMLEGHYLYNIIDPEADFSSYKLLVLPDNITVSGRFREKLEKYMENGGKLLLSGKSGLDQNGKFAFDFGVEFVGKGDHQPSYLRPCFDLHPNGETSYIMYNTSYDITLNDRFKGEVRALRVDSYFNRTAEHFCSHLHTPYDKSRFAPGALITDNIAYIGWNIFAEYAEIGAIHLRSAVFDMIDGLLGQEKTLSTSLPSMGIAALMSQPFGNGSRLVNHLLYAIPKVRGVNTEIIEDIPDVYNTDVSVKCDQKPTRVYTVPDGKDLDFTYENGRVSYSVPKFNCAVLVIIEF